MVPFSSKKVRDGYDSQESIAIDRRTLKTKSN